MRDPQLNHDSYPAANLWLQLKLWAELRYDTDGTDRFLLLALLFSAQELLLHRRPEKETPLL